MQIHFAILNTAILILTIIKTWNTVVDSMPRYGIDIPQFVHRNRHDSRTRYKTKLKSLGPQKLAMLRSGKYYGTHILPQGFAIVDGEIMDVSYKIIQKRVEGGSAYFTFFDRNQKWPLYIRPVKEIGWNFIVFQDPYYWRGSGHLILLKKVLGISLAKIPGMGPDHIMYDAYIISLRRTLHPLMDMYDPVFIGKIQRRRKQIEVIRAQRNNLETQHKQRLRDTQGRPGRRKKRSANVKKMKSKKQHIKFDPSCYLQRLNVTKVLARVQKAKNANREAFYKATNKIDSFKTNQSVSGTNQTLKKLKQQSS